MDKVILDSKVERIVLKNSERPSVMVITVLVQGGRGDDYAAYRGAIMRDAYVTADDQWVANHGDKLSFEKAQGIFPYIHNDRYRR